MNQDKARAGQNLTVPCIFPMKNNGQIITNFRSQSKETQLLSISLQGGQSVQGNSLVHGISRVLT